LGTRAEHGGRAHVPDVAIVDIRMPPTQTDEGIQAAHEIRRRHPDIGVRTAL
jgi:DNA-binding NarL/FixJ family response regulator